MSERRCFGTVSSMAAALAVTVALTVAAARAEPAPWPEDAYNPVQSDGDLSLPMPCGGVMTFRPVAVVGSRPFDDQQIGLGNAEEKNGYLGGPRLEYVGGPFPDPANQSRRVFYIGKYEVSVLQMATFGSSCPALEPAGLLPATGVSWFDAVAMANRYSEWLLANARQALPKVDEVPAFVRLPTEAEWEYAARGGLAVDQVAFAGGRFPMPSEDGSDAGKPADYIWHQGSESANGALHPIGSLKPNPLGVHDILGNAAEMVLEPFRLNRRGRPHGQAGGMIVRGGDFTMPADQQRTAWRQEVPYYDAATGSATRNERFGFRLVLAGPTAAAAWPMERVDMLTAAWRELPLAAEGDSTDLREKRAMDEIAYAALTAESATLRTQLQEALADIENGRAERNDARDRLVRSLIRNGAISAERVLGEDLRFRTQKAAFDKADAVHREAQQNFTVIERGGKAGLIAEGKQNLAEVARQLEARASSVKAARAELDTTLIRYGDTVIELAKEYGIDLLRHQADMLRAELETRGHKDLIAAAGLFVRHIDEFQRLGPPKPDAWRNDIVQTLSPRR